MLVKCLNIYCDLQLQFYVVLPSAKNVSYKEKFKILFA